MGREGIMSPRLNLDGAPRTDSLRAHDTVPLSQGVLEVSMSACVYEP